MDEVKLALLILAGLVVLLAIGLVFVNFRTARFADKALEHCMAFHTDQREFMRTRFEAEHQEYLLREMRARQRLHDRDGRRRAPEMQPETDLVPNIPIESNTQT